ncbi:MAG: cell wall anchor protein [Muribaculaceae bacterium]|nr:cell wall anchor protein [Muribaculaceae bacterium]MCF0219656.1 cell wall anchor protein [Muribaculaceae bacterium]
MKLISRIILSLTLALAALPALRAESVETIKQELDSAYILMGNVTPLRIELITAGRPQGRLEVSEKQYPPEVEIAEQGTADTTDLGNDRYQITRELIVQSFDSGLYVIPPVNYIVGKDTFSSKPLALKVVPVPVDTLTDIHDYASVADSGLRWYDRLPDWLVDYGFWIILALVLIGGGTWAYLRYGRKVKKIIGGAVIKREPPYDAAMRQLNQLREQHLCEAGREREFYTRLTEILRVYLEDRFGINAMEMTTTQILNALSGNEQTRTPRRYMTSILEMADFVKFAKVRPLPDDNVKSLNDAVNFVEDTKPLPEPDPKAAAPKTKQKPVK